MSRPNVFSGEFQMERPETGVKGRLLAPDLGARELGASIYELAPGASGFNMHAHYGNEEMFVVLQGSPTMRTPGGDQQLQAGDVLVCRRGREGMHALANRSAEPALVLAVSTANSPDVVIYPETEMVGVATRHPFLPIPEGSDEGIVGAFRISDNLRK